MTETEKQEKCHHLWVNGFFTGRSPPDLDWHCLQCGARREKRRCPANDFYELEAMQRGGVKEERAP